MAMKLLVANRGEIAVRILRAAAELGIPTVAVYSQDDAQALHTRRADEAYPLRGAGAAAYLDMDQILTAARERGCTAVHPGYGFLSERAEFARRCAEAGVTFAGPDPETLAILGDKTRARALAEQCGVPVLPATPSPVTVEEAKAFLIVLRKAYGLGAQTMGGGNHKLSVFTLSWPTGEFGGMGLEGQVKLGRRRELKAIEDPLERKALYDRYVAEAYERSKALNAAYVFEVDDVIDPADSRRWLVAGLRASPPPEPRTGKKRPCIDTW